MRIASFLRRVVPSLFALTLLAPAGGVRAADADNPEYKQWAAHKVGTTVKRRQTVDAGGQKQEMDMTARLVELSADKAVVEDAMAMNVNGQSMTMPGQKRTIPAKLAAGAGGAPQAPPADAPKADMKQGEETVTVAGKAYKCKTVETKMAHPQGGQITSKVWTSDEVPGGVVKMTSSATAPVKTETTLTLVGIEPGK